MLWVDVFVQSGSFLTHCAQPISRVYRRKRRGTSALTRLVVHSALILLRNESLLLLCWLIMFRSNCSVLISTCGHPRMQTPGQANRSAERLYLRTVQQLFTYISLTGVVQVSSAWTRVLFNHGTITPPLALCARVSSICVSS